MGVAFYSTYIQSLWDCPVRDNMLVESEMKIIESPVRDDMYFYRTIMIKKVKAPGILTL